MKYAAGRKSIRQFLQYIPGQEFLDFAMARHRLALFGAGILIPIVFAAMTEEHAA